MNNGTAESIIIAMQKETLAPLTVRPRDLLEHPDALIIGSIFILTLVFHIVTAARTVTFSDSGDFLMALSTVGNCHGPGYPLYLLTCKIFTLVFPFGSLAFRASLYSSLFASLCACLLYWIVVRLTRSRIGGAVAALVFAFSFTFWYQTVIPETYSLDTFLIALLVVLALRWERQLHQGNRAGASNTMCVFALAFGLAMANHYTVLFLLPAFAFFALGTDWRETLAPKNLARMTAFFALGLLPYLYEPTAAFRGPAYNYGDPSTLTRWFQHFTLHYQRGGLFAYPLRFFPARFWRYFGTLTTEFPYFAWLGVLGLVSSFFSRRNKRALFLVLLFLLSLIPVMTYSQLESVLRAHFYYPGYLLFSLWIGIGAASLAQLAGRLSRRRDRLVGATAILVVCLLLLASPLLALVIHYRKVDKSSYDYARQMATKMLVPAEREAVILVGNDNTFFPPRYMQVVEHLRPDVRVVNVTSIGSPGFHGLDLLASLIPGGPSIAGFERFEAVVENNFGSTPVYSADPSLYKPDWVAVWLGYLIRLYPHGTLAPGGRVSPAIKVKGAYSDLDSDAREAVLTGYTLKANVETAAGDFSAASNSYRKALLTFERDLYVPVLYSCGDFSGLFQNWGQVLSHLKQPARITEFLARARKIDPDFYSYDLARAHFDLGNIPAAIDELKGLLAFEPDNAQSLCLLGESYYRQGRDEDAVRVLEKSIEREPSNPAARFLKAEALVSLGKLADAAKEYQEVVKLDPAGPLGQAAQKKLCDMK